MGTILTAHCTKCGFEKKEIYFGGGMRDFMKVCNVPAINKKTGRLVVKNILSDAFEEKYIFYNEPEMCSSKRGNSTLKWNDIILQEKNNFCPKCKQFSLSFVEWACYD